MQTDSKDNIIEGHCEKNGKVLSAAQNKSKPIEPNSQQLGKRQRKGKGEEKKDFDFDQGEN